MWMQRVAGHGACTRSVPESRPKRALSRRHAWIAVVLALLWLCAGVTRAPGDVLVFTHNVMDHGAIAETGADNTAAFQKAMDMAFEAGGGIVYAPPGRYTFKGFLIVPPGVTLRGEWQLPTEKGLGNVTVLQVLAGKGKEGGPAFLTLPNSCCVRDLTFFYPGQDVSSITPYPYTIALTNVDTPKYKGHPFCTMVHRVTLVNSYQGIFVANGHLHFLKRVVGTPVKQGVYMNVCSDIGRMAECEFSADVWSRAGLPGAPSAEPAGKALRDYLFANATAYTVGYSDTEVLTNLRARGYRYGLRLVGYRHTGVRKQRPPRGNSYGQAYGLQLLSCRRALQIDSVQDQVGYEIAASRFTASERCVSGTGNAGIQFNSCTLRAESGGICAVGPTAGESRGELTFQNCTFEDWGKAAIVAQRGLLSVVDCDFKADKKIAVLEGGVAAALLVGNRFASGNPLIESKCRRTLIDHASLKLARLNAVPYTYAPTPGPASDRVLNVCENPYAALADGKTDDTAAVQKALDALAKAGGTCFLPAGRYRIDETLTVPPGVELRGIWDGCARPAHNTAGTLLLAYRDRGKPDASPLITLGAKSGLRGIGVLHPEQNDPRRVATYPWVVRARGEACYVVSVCLMNPYRGIDIAGDRHLVSNLYMTPLGTGLRIGKSKGGIVEDYHAHPQFWGLRVVADYDLPNHAESIGCMSRHGTCMVLADCRDETIVNFSTWKALDGLRFASGDGTARIINPTFDQVRICYAIGRARDIEVVNTQGGYLCVQTANGFEGFARFFNSVWRGGTYPLDLRGPGAVLMQQDRFKSGGTHSLRGGHLRFEGGIHRVKNYRLEKNVKRLEMVGAMAVRPPADPKGRTESRCTLAVP